MSHGSHEKTDAQAGPLVVFAGVMVAFIVITMLACAVYFRIMAKVHRINPDEHVAQTVPGKTPKLQVSGPADLHHFKAEQNHTLSSYGWVDKKNGIVHIPIEKAMHDVLSRGELKRSEY